MARKKAAAAPTSPTPESRMQLRESILLKGDVRLGDVMDDWQKSDFDALDDPQYRRWYFERPRGHSKTGDAGTEIVVELMQGPKGGEIISVAMVEDQTQILFADVAGKLRRGGYEARGEVRILKDKIIAVTTGSTYTAMPSDAPSAWGLRPSMIVYDEIEEVVKRDLWDALYSAAVKNRDCKIVIIGTAGYRQDTLAWELRSLAQREPSWCLRVRHQCASWIDAKDLEEQRRILPGHVYSRLHDNEWTDQHGAWLTAQQVDRVFAGGVQPGARRRVLGLDIGISRNRSALTITGLDAAGIYSVEHLETWTPEDGQRQDLTAIESRVIELVKRERPDAVVMDPYQTIQMSQRLAAEFKRLRIRCEVVADPITQDSRDKLFGHVRDAVVDQRVRSIEYPAFRSELLGMAFKRTVSGKYRVDHLGADGADDHLFAVGLAMYRLGEDAMPTRKTFENMVWDPVTRAAVYRSPVTKLDPPAGQFIREEVRTEQGQHVIYRIFPDGYEVRDRLGYVARPPQPYDPPWFCRQCNTPQTVSAFACEAGGPDHQWCRTCGDKNDHQGRLWCQAERESA